MLEWFFKKRDDSHKWNALHSTLKASFSNIKKEIAQIHNRVDIVHNKHNHHSDKLQDVLHRLEKIEVVLFTQVTQQAHHIYNTKTMSISSPKEIPNQDYDLTDMQQAFLQALASLQKETPNKWISLKYLAQELYPNKEYSQIRSTVSQYISVLEDLGLVKRRRKGKHAFVLSTDKNPFLRRKKELEIENKIQVKEKEESED